ATPFPWPGPIRKPSSHVNLKKVPLFLRILTENALRFSPLYIGEICHAISEHCRRLAWESKGSLRDSCVFHEATLSLPVISRLQCWLASFIGHRRCQRSSAGDQDPPAETSQCRFQGSRGSRRGAGRSWREGRACNSGLGRCPHR